MSFGTRTASSESSVRPAQSIPFFEISMVICRNCGAGIAEQLDARLDALRNRPHGITFEQALRFRQRVLATIEESEAPDTFVVSWEVTSDEWGLALTIKNFDEGSSAGA